jgi:hypothetical protein
VRVRTFELRILGVTLAGLWFAAFALVLIGYRPGGPTDRLVGLAAIGPLLIALAAVRWPPVARGLYPMIAIAWLALGAMLLLVPSLVGLVAQLTGNGPQTLLPSAEAAYPWILALAATCLFAGLGLARRRLGETALRRRRLVLGAGFGLILAVAAGTLFAAAAIANELALSDRPSIASRFGPTDPAIVPPACTEALTVSSTARVMLEMDTSIDGRYAGSVRLDGIRSGADVAWNGFAATRFTLGQRGLVRIAGTVWERLPGGTWERVDAFRGDNLDLDRQLILAALQPTSRGVAEDRGLAYIEGARARHCRLALDGATLRSALPQIELLVGDTDTGTWRGNLDFWVFADGQLGQAEGRIEGPAAGLDPDALLANVRFRMLAIDRGLPVTVFAPAPGRQ